MGRRWYRAWVRLRRAAAEHAGTWNDGDAELQRDGADDVAILAGSGEFELCVFGDAEQRAGHTDDGYAVGRDGGVSIRCAQEIDFGDFDADERESDAGVE